MRGTLERRGQIATGKERETNNIIDALQKT